MRKNKFPSAVPWISPTPNPWRFHRLPPPNQTELEYLLSWINYSAGHRNGRVLIWRRRIRSIFVCLLNENNNQVKDFKYKQHVDTILIRKKIAVNHFHLFRSFDGKESAQFMSHSLQIKTWRWHLTNVNDFTRSIYWIFIFIFLFS
jgi:hypothetical protein